MSELNSSQLTHLLTPFSFIHLVVPVQDLGNCMHVSGLRVADLHLVVVDSVA